MYILLNLLKDRGWNAVLSHIYLALIGYSFGVTWSGVETLSVADEFRIALDVVVAIAKAFWNLSFEQLIAAAFMPFEAEPHSLALGRIGLAWIVGGLITVILADAVIAVLALLHIDWRTPLRRLFRRSRRQSGYRRPPTEPERARQQMEADE